MPLLECGCIELAQDFRPKCDQKLFSLCPSKLSSYIFRYIHIYKLFSVGSGISNCLSNNVMCDCEG